MAGENKGRITQVIGAVLDVRFDEGKLPYVRLSIDRCTAYVRLSIIDVQLRTS